MSFARHLTSVETLADPTASPFLARARSEIVPRPVLKPELLSYHLLRPRDPGPADLALLGHAYQCWSDVWTQTFAELDDAKTVPSDDFTRQDEIAALFHEWECIGTAAIRWVDLSSRIHMDDSYFAIWSEEAIEAAIAHGNRICIVSSFVVAIPWRRARGGRVRDLLGALLVERFLQSDADTLVATVRNDHGMNSLCYKLGLIPLARNAILHGVPVDLVAFHREKCARQPLLPAMEEMVLALLPGGTK
jgi:hypothetical protein